LKNTDDFGHDPAVLMMRGVYKRLEESHQLFLSRLNIDPFDSRLRKWRELARYEFERSFSQRIRPGGPLKEKEAAALYLSGLTQILSRDGIEVPPNILDSFDGKGSVS
jgi:hypothetical protein